jgi:hypothetical protein
MARTKPKQLPAGTNYLERWENQYKPLILSYYEVPIDVVAETLGISVTKVQEQLRSGYYDYGIARPCPGGTYRYEVMPLRLIAFIEGSMNSIKNISYGKID